MFVQSNDLFYSPGDGGIKLSKSHSTVNGDITPYLSLWDAGTEKNEEPGYGPNQVIRQTSANTGITESKPVKKVDDGFSYPPTEKIIKVTISR